MRFSGWLLAFFQTVNVFPGFSGVKNNHECWQVEIQKTSGSYHLSPFISLVRSHCLFITNIIILACDSGSRIN